MGVKVYRVFVVGIDIDGNRYEDTKGIFTSEEKALRAIEYGKHLNQRCYNSGYWHYEEYTCDIYDDIKEIKNL